MKGGGKNGVFNEGQKRHRRRRFLKFFLKKGKYYRGALSKCEEWGRGKILGGGKYRKGEHLLKVFKQGNE